MIKNLGNHRILIQGIKNFGVLDFNPLLNSLENNAKFQELKPENFLLAHWNKLLKLPAYYCPQTGEYIAVNEENILIQKQEHFWAGVLKDDFPNTLPTSVLLYPNASMIKVDEILLIDELNNSNENIYDGSDSSLPGASDPSLSTLDSTMG